MTTIKQRLISLNFALLMLISLIQPAGAVDNEKPATDAAHQYEQYVIVNGVEYDATKNHSGTGWHSYYDEYNNDLQVNLRDYNGSSIISNIDLGITIGGTSVIAGTSYYGIYTTGELHFGVSVRNGQIGHLTVSGADGFSAIHSDKTTFIGGDLTAIGGNCPAISANEDITLSTYWPSKTWVGDTAEGAQEGIYSNQTYVSFERIPYIMTLHGNGGVDANNKDEKQIIYTTGTAGYLFLYPYFKTFSNGEKQLIGWSDSADNVDKIHAVDEEYQYADNTYSADLYAVWEDTVHKAVVLKNYYGEYTQTGHHFGDTLPIPIEKGMTYTLPDQTCSGCRFDGWLAEDGTTLYPAGTVITVDETISFTARFTPLTLKIDGQEYDASQDHSGRGWYYYASSSNPIQLRIENSYSGQPIDVPTSAEIRLHKSLTSNTAHAPITIHGDATIDISNYNETDNPVVVSGADTPAIIADGDVTISVSDNDDQRIKFIVKSGSPNVPAIQAKHIKTYSKMLYAGTDAENISPVGKYSGEAYAEFIYASYYRITLPSKSTVPSAPQYDGQTFVGWRDIAVDWTQPDELQKWYMPGDTLEASLSTTLVAEYSVDNNDSTTTFVIDGQGGQTSQGSYYFVAFVSNFQLVEYRFPNNLFSYEGKTLTGYNTAADGSGTAYQPNDKLPESTFIQRLYAQWKDNNSGSTGGSGGGASGGGSGGGAPVTAANTISAPNISNGKVSFDKNTAKKGDTVTVTVTPDAGYRLDKLTITDAKGKTIAVTKKSDSKYTFTMPDSKVTITPTFSKIEDVKPSKTDFDDVVSSAWYADAVRYVTDKGLMNGTDDNQFSPNDTTTRGMLMTVLARYAGEDTTGGATWYEKSMNWAKAKGVSDGTNPNADITREQLVTMMYRYAGSPKADGKLDIFTDVASVSSYAANAMQWAVANGIVNGSNGKLNPQNNATRAEVAAILMRFCEMSK